MTALILALLALPVAVVAHLVRVWLEVTGRYLR